MLDFFANIEKETIAVLSLVAVVILLCAIEGIAVYKKKK